MKLPDKEEYLIKDVEDVLVSHFSGSHAYGMALPTSDVDVRGIFCAPKKAIVTPWHTVKEVNISSQEDTKLYELTRFMKMYLEGNPNIIETLWVDEESIIQTSPAYNLLRQYRHDLLSKKVAFSFSGYAMSQMKRIKGHNKFIENPKPKEPPQQKDYVAMVQNFTAEKVLPREFSLERFPKSRLIPFGGNLFGLYTAERGRGYTPCDKYGNLNKVFDNESRAEWGAPQLMVKFNKSDFEKALVDHKNYWTWKKNRNEKRSLLEEKHGYDTKHASHLVRLLNMCEEILRGEGVLVKRPDAEQLLAIRNGVMTYEEIVDWAAKKDTLVREVLYKESELPKKPNLHLATDVLMSAQNLYWENADDWYQG